MRRIILFTLTVFIWSCGGNINTKHIGVDSEITKIAVVSRPDSIITKVSDIASDIEYIPLQQSTCTQIYTIDKIVARENKIYINLVGNILCFNNQGHFLYKLYGNSKEQEKNVVAIYDFDIDTADTTLIVLYGNKILQFQNTGSGFNYLYTIRLGRFSPDKLNFVPGTNKILLTSIRRKGYEPSLNVLININCNTLSYKPSYFNRFNPVENRIWDNIIHYKFDDKLYFRERFNDTVYSIDNESNNFKPVLILNSHLPSTNSKNINDPEHFRILPNVINIFEVPRYLYYAFNFGNHDYRVFYDKNENRKYEIDTENGVLKDDIAGGPDFDPMFCSEGKIYSCIKARELKDYAENEVFNRAQVQDNQKHEDLKKLALSLKDSDNPIITLVRLKN
jgi:hypothetical protein